MGQLGGDYPVDQLSEDWQLRTATRDDLSALTALDGRAFAGSDGDDPYGFGSFRQFHDLFAELLVVAERSDGEIAGYALGGAASGQHRGWILGLAVDPTAQGQGLGRALTLELLDRMAGIGIKEVQLTVHPGNERALQLYGRLGFREVDSDTEYFGPGKPRVLMRGVVGDVS